MSARGVKTSTGQDLRLWPVLLLLSLVVLAPATCLLWFMDRAIENERLAMRQTLYDVYRRDLYAVQARVERFWQQRAAALEAFAPEEPGSAVFAACVRAGLADSVVCYDAQRRLVYPSAPANPPQEAETDPAGWADAWRLEFTENDPAAAARAYAALAENTVDASLAARALQAQARCLVQSGRREEAIGLITGTLSDEKYSRALDPQGRLIVPSAQLMALELMGDRRHPAFAATAERLRRRVEDYSDTTLAATQRRFLMHELADLLPEKTGLPLLGAEDLAARFVEAHPSPRLDAALHPSQLADVWQLASPRGLAMALFRTETVVAQSGRATAEAGLPAAVTARLSPPDAEAAATDVFYSLPAGRYLPGWQLTLSLADGGLADAAASRRIALYAWTGTLVVAAICVLAALIAQVFRRQMRLARLKNDLVATVSHELKTPLSSIRLLVDTLLDDEPMDPGKTREYLELVAQENMRLSRLIDNFLAFSRMERNKHAFQFAETTLAAVIDVAVGAMRERLERPGCWFEVELAPDLPPIFADAGALVTIVLNLLDNACKYTGDEKRIRLRAYAENGGVCIAVTDNGIGMTRAAAKKVFEQFYQVDRRLSRTAGGCGLGLSIVRFIADAHGGTVHVASRPGQGSTFTVKLPAGERKKTESRSPMRCPEP